MNQLSHTTPLKSNSNGLNVPLYRTYYQLQLSKFFRSKSFASCIVACVLIITPFAAIFSQSNTCIPGMVMNANGDPWTEECYLNDSCMVQGNPCQANDVQLVGVFIADAMGGPVPACTIGDSVDVLLWGTFTNGTGTNRYAIRSNTEIFIDGNFHIELNACSFDVLPAGTSDVALIGQFSYVCGQQVSITNTWVAWSTSVAQCSNPVGANYNNVCNEYSPSKCSKNFEEIVFLTPNFSYTCGDSTSSTTTEVCFNNLTFGGAPPLEYYWEFGDGDTSALENPCHIYNATTGVFLVVLTVTDSNGVQAGVQLTLNLDSLVCCNLTTICPDEDGGTFTCIEDVPDPDPDLITVVDSCGPVTITSSDQVTGTGCGTDTMFITRTYIVADSINTDTCTQTFSVVDDEAPVIVTCAADITVACDILVPDADISLIVASDSCSGMVTITAGADVITSQTCADRYIITRTYIATDACGNSSSCQQTITVFDDIPPTFTFVPANTTVDCDTTPVFGTPVATDNCGGIPTITSTDSSAIAANCAGGTVTRTWTATDSCGNTSTASQTLTFVDTEAPTFTFVPADTMIACDSPAVFGIPIVTDNCDMSVSLDSTTTTNPMASCAGTTTRVWTATDDCGNTATASQVITFVDTVAPMFTFVPVDATVDCSDMPAFGTPTATDNCDQDVAITSMTTTDTILNCAGGSTTRTWTATDNCGNTATASQTLTFEDNTPPEITCPADITVECASLVPAANTAAVITSDDCGGIVTVTVAADVITGLICPNNYIITRVYTATDACLNTAVCTQIITVFDSTPPSITCPADVTVQCSDDVPPADISTVIASDNCGGTPTVTVAADVITAQTCANRFVITRVYTATDSCGNMATCTQIITVFDSTPPALTCPPDVIVDCEDSTLPPGTGMATATDNCGGVPIVDYSDVTIAGVCPQEFNVTRTWTATDECGNSTACVQMIMVQDTTPPSFNPACQAEFEFYTSEGSVCPADATVSLEVGDIVGESETWTVGGNEIPGLNGCLFDNCGDPDSLEARVDSIIVTGDNCSSVITIYFTILNDCDSLNVNLFISAVTIVDDVPPMITCPADVTIDCDESTSPDSTGMATAIDNCQLAGLTFTDSIAIGLCPQEMTIFRTWVADDSCGNMSSCLQIITVQDTVAPMLVGVPADVTVQCDSVPPPPMVTATDNCTEVPTIFPASSLIPGNCLNNYTIFRSWVAVDECGNSSTASQTVTVIDTQAPSITCPADVTIECTESTLPGTQGGTNFQEDFDGIGGSTAGGAGTYSFPAGWLKMNVDNLTPAANVSYVNEAWERREDFNFNVIDSAAFSTSWYNPAGTANDWMWTPPISIGPNGMLNWNAVTYDPLFRDGYEVRIMVAPDVPTGGTGVIGNMITNSTVLFSTAAENTFWTARNVSLAAYAGQTVRIAFRNNSIDKFLLLIDDVVVTSEATATGIATATDECDPAPTLMYSDVTVAGACPQEYTITRTWTATDTCGNSSSCIQTITVDDSTAPVITCPADVTINCEDSTSPDSTGVATAIDSCQLDVIITWADSIVPGLCPQEMTILRTWTADDSCGNASTCLQTIIVQDITPPTITCPMDVTIQTGVGEFIPAIDFGVLTDFALFTAAGAFDNLGPTIVSGDIGTNVGTITGFPPGVVIGQMHAANGVTAQAAADVAVAYGQLVAITCGTVLGTTLGNGQVLTPDVYCLGAASTVNLNLVLDAQGDPNAVFIFQIDGALSTNALSNVILINGASSCNVYWQVNGAFAAGTNSIFRGNLFVAGAISLNFGAELEGRALSTAGAISTNSNVVNSLAPCSSGEIGMATATDNCGSTLISYSDDIMGGECCGDVIITRTWIATDSCGNSATCAQIITVEDITPPMITCPTDITVSCEADVPVCPTTFAEFDALPGASATDICDTTFSYSCTTGPLIGGPCGGTITRTHTVTDDCGNSSTCIQTITVDDNIAPEITCPADLTINCEESTSPDSTGMATAVDNCQLSIGITSTDSIAPGICLQEITIFRTWIAEDSCGNVSSCLQTITVQDTTPPVATFIPPDITIECDENIDSVLAEVPIFMDNCDPDVPALGSIEVVFNELCPQGPTFIIAWSGVDDCGNSTTVGRTVVVIDTTGPVITCPPDVTIECTDDTSTETNGFATATDNCDSLAVVDFSDGIVEGECPQEYTINRTWTATDACGNSNTCLQTIFVIDTTAPVMTCPANLTVECAESVPQANTMSVTATDNCGIPVITHIGDITSDSSCVNRLTVTRTYQAIDECGNSSTCEQIITVFDATPPVILTCPADVTVQCASQVPTVNIAAVSATDNCNGTPVITHDGDVISNMTCINRFIVTRTYRATDECGNTATCAQIITVFDNTPPSITCPANVTVQCASQVPPVNTGSVTASDNCAGMTTITHVGDVITNMTCVNRFILTRTYRATDECGNSATCAQVITVFDNTPPTITCPANVTVECASDVPPVNVATVTTADNCTGTVTVTHVSDVVTNMTCLNRFTLTRTYRATDACGNSATCTQVITVFDDTPPVITFSDPLLEGVPNGGTVEVQCFGQDPEWELPTFNAGSVTVTDNCAGTVNVVFTDVLVDEGDCEVDGYINLYRLTWTATDVCGNSSSAFVFLALIDTIPPVIHGIPEDITVNCDEIPEPPSGIFATDECLCACVILYEQSDPAPGCQDGQVITRTWTAEDDCGNVTVEVQNITLIDNEGPELIMMHPDLVGIEDGTILQYTCNEGGIPDFFDELSAESINSPISCGTSGIISFNERTIFANNCKFWGYIESRTFTWEGIDQCGNISTLTITAQVIDTEPPVILGVPDTACIDDPSLQEIEVVDNCDNASLTFWDVTIENPCGDEPAIMRTYEAYDNCGNYVRDTAILLPNDFSHPIMEFVDPVLAALEFGEILIVECNLENGQYTPYGPGDVNFIDACMVGVTVNFTETVTETRDCSDGVVAVLQLSWTATDVCGNLSEALITAHVVDNTSPVFVNFETEITIDCGDEMPEVFATDNCGEVTITTEDVIIPGLCEFEYDVMRTHTAMDPCGNRAVRRQLIHVGDGSGPEIEGVIEEVCDDLSIPEVTAYDPCADQFVEVTMVEDTLDVPCNDGIVIERIWTAVDACGHMSEVRQLIVLGDQTPPEIQVPTHSIIRRFDGHLFNMVFLSQTGMMEQLNALNAGSVFVLDDCDQEIEAEFTLVTVYSDNCEEDGYFERRTYTWVATDVCGNSDVISFTVNIMDDIPPVLNGVPENETIICDDLPPVPVVTASDPAQPVTIEYIEVVESGDGPGQFVAYRTWTATDACGNSTQATQSIIWIPDSFLDCSVLLPGSVECNSHGVVIGSDLFGGIGEVTYMWEIVGEKCFIQSGQGTPEIIIYVGWSDVQISLTVTDEFGCSSVCSATLSCIDPLDPLVITDQHILKPGSTVDHEGKSTDDVDQTIIHHFQLWPNPANASVNLSFESLLDQEVQFTLTNYLGQVVLNNKITAVKGYNGRKIDVSKLPEGSYLMQLISEKETRTKMLVLFRQ